MHAEEPAAGENVPGPQATHASALLPPGLAYPAAHCVQLAAPGAPFAYPGAHATHVDDARAPIADDAVPGGHAKQAVGDPTPPL